MKINILKAGFLALALTFPFQVTAESKEMSPSLKMLLFVGMGNKLASLEERRNFANVIQEYWRDLDGKVPRISPSDKAWVEKEYNAGGERSMYAAKSKEGALSRINEMTDMCLYRVGQVLASQEIQVKKQFEMYHWVKLVRCFNESSSLDVSLERSGLRFNDFDAEYDENKSIQTPVSSVVIGIIVDNMIPSAMAETMSWDLQQ